MTTCDTSPERQAFEVWMQERFPSAPLYRRDAKGSLRFGQYCSSAVEDQWETWKARGAIAAPAASIAPLSDEPVAEVIKWRTFSGHTAWDFKVFDKTLENGAKLYAAPPTPSDKQSKSICFFCGEAMDGRHESDCPEANPSDRQEFRVLAERKDPVAWADRRDLERLRDGTLTIAGAGAKQNPDNVPLFTHHTPDDASVVVESYSLENDPDVIIRRVRQRDGAHLWAIRSGACCLNKSGEWEDEPIPSSRDDAFISRCRFDTAAVAIDATMKQIRALMQDAQSGEEKKS